MKHPELFDLVHFHVVWLSALTDSAIAESGNIMLETCQKVAFAAFEVELREAFVFTKGYLFLSGKQIQMINDIQSISIIAVKKKHA